ncbi:MAG TPA: redoxin domain-containing protein [Solirubrobacteraceae bacterium]|nr:redoxin domain-containing protein [Solirubrobacteraceae bacterium]
MASLRMDQQRGRPVLLEFWDFCRPNSIRTLPYLKAWHARYAGRGLRVVGAHSSGFPPSEDPAAVAAAVERLGIEYPVVVDVDHQIWQEYENLGWPARYLWNADGFLHEFHYGEGAYAETERAIQELLGLEQDTVPPVRPEDAPGARLVPQSEDVAGPYSGPYAAGGVWAVFGGHGTATVNGLDVMVAEPGAHELLRHEHHTEGVLDLSVSSGLDVLAVCFTPGLADLTG